MEGGGEGPLGIDNCATHKKRAGKGPFIYDVRRGWREGGAPEADVGAGKLRECDGDKGERVRNRNILWMSHMNST